MLRWDAWELSLATAAMEAATEAANQDAERLARANRGGMVPCPMPVILLE